MRLPAPLRGFLAASALFSFICFGTEAFCRSVLHWHDPYDYPGIRVFYTFYKTRMRFGDFHPFFDKFVYFHSRLFFSEKGTLPYPAPAVAVYKLFLIPQPHPNHGSWAIVRFVGAMLAASWIALFLWRSALRHAGLSSPAASGFVLATYAFSFAFWFEFMQGNIEWIISLLLCLAIWAFSRKSFKYAAICIGLAGSMKLFPIIFIGLFLPVRRYREIALTLLTAVISTVCSLWLVCPDIAYSWHQTNLALLSFNHDYVSHIRSAELGFDHSLFALIKLLLNSFSHNRTPGANSGIYLICVAAAGIALFFLRIRHLPFPNQVLSLSIAAILLPPVSYDYTLIHLYPGLLLLTLLACHQEGLSPGQTIKGLWPVLLLLAFILSPESEIIWRGVRYAGQAKALALLALGYCCLLWPFDLSNLPKNEMATVHHGFVDRTGKR